MRNPFCFFRFFLPLLLLNLLQLCLAFRFSFSGLSASFSLNLFLSQFLLTEFFGFFSRDFILNLLIIQRDQLLLSHLLRCLLLLILSIFRLREVFRLTIDNRGR